jgi:hypothetical protein
LSEDLKVGDYVRLTQSNNQYVPVGSLLKIESLSQIVDRAGIVQVYNVIHKGSKYHVHREVIRKVNYIEPEKVAFS